MPPATRARARVAGGKEIWNLLPHAKDVVLRRLLVFFLGNLLAVGLLAWSMTERLPMAVEINNGQVIGSAGDTRLAAPAPVAAGTGVIFFLQGADERAALRWPAQAMAPPPSPDLKSLLYRLGAESAWANPRIVDLTNDTATTFGTATTLSLDDSADAPPPIPWFGDWFHHPLGGLTTATPGALYLPTPAQGHVIVQADLLRPRNAAGLAVLAPDGAQGLLFFVRPENRDIVWYRLQGGQLQGPIAQAPYRAFVKDPIAGTQDILRETLGGYPAALVLILLALALGTLERRVLLRHRLRLALPLRDTLGSWLFNRSSRLRLGASALAAALIALAGLGLYLTIADTLLERIPHVQDSVAYLFQAKTFALGRLWMPLPPHVESFAHEFIVMHDGRWFSKYPPGWPLLLAIGVLVHAPWVVDPIFGVLSLVLLYRIGREVYRERVGLLAATLGLSAPFVMFLAGSMMSHTSGLFFTLLMTWGFWRTLRAARPLRPALLTGASLGVLILIRPYSALVIAAPFVLYAIIALGKRPADTFRRYLPLAIAVLPFVVGFLAYNQALTGRWTYPPQQLWWPFDQVGFGPDHGPWGNTPLDGLNNTSRNLAELLTHGFGWPTFLTLAFVVVPFAARRARAWDWLFLGGFIALVGGYALWWADGIMYGPRFYFEGFGFLILLSARGVEVAGDLARWGWDAAAIGKGQPATLTPALVGLVVAGLIAYNLAFYLPGQWQLYHGYNYTSRTKLNLVEASGIHHAIVLVNPGPWYAWWEYGMVFSANDPLLKGDIIYARDLGDAANAALRADYPDRSLYRLVGNQLIPVSR